jgi:hypothetical protein
MVRMWALVPIPQGGVHSIGELVAHEMNLCVQHHRRRPAQRQPLDR